MTGGVFLGRADDHVAAAVDDVVQRMGHGSPPATEDHPTDTARVEVGAALLRGQLAQLRVPTGPAPPGGAVDPTAGKLLGCALERERQ